MDVPTIKSFAGSMRDDRCLEVWFANKVTDVDRAWLLEAINEKAERDRREARGLIFTESRER